MMFLCLALLCRILVTLSLTFEVTDLMWPLDGGRETLGCFVLFFLLLPTDFFVNLVGHAERSECVLWVVGKKCEVSENIC